MIYYDLWTIMIVHIAVMFFGYKYALGFFHKDVKIDNVYCVKCFEFMSTTTCI